MLALRRHFERKLVVALRNVGCVLKLQQTAGASRLGTLVSHAGFWVIFVTQRPSPKKDFYLYTFSFEVARWVTRKQQLRRRLMETEDLNTVLTSMSIRRFWGERGKREAKNLLSLSLLGRPDTQVTS